MSALHLLDKCQFLDLGAFLLDHRILKGNFLEKVAKIVHTNKLVSNLMVFIPLCGHYMLLIAVSGCS